MSISLGAVHRQRGRNAATRVVFYAVDISLNAVSACVLVTAIATSDFFFCKLPGTALV